MFISIGARGRWKIGGGEEARLRNDDVNVSTLLIEKREMTHDMQQQTYSTPKNLRTYDRDRQDIQLLEAHFGKKLCGCVVITNRLPKRTSFSPILRTHI